MATAERVSKAEAEAERLVAKYLGDVTKGTIPIKVESIALSLGLQAGAGDFQVPNVSGYYSRGSSKLIVSKFSDHATQFYVIAHMIGHQVLHMDTIQDETLPVTGLFKLWEPESDTEKEAIGFASVLLMPKSAVDIVWAGTRDAEKIASLFVVPAPVANFRLQRLGLI